MTLAYRKSTSQVELQPRLENVHAELVDLVEETILRLKDLPCIYTTNTGYARQSEPAGKCKVFPDCVEATLFDDLAQLKRQLDRLLWLPRTLEAELSRHAQILAQDSKKYSSWLKDEDHTLEVFASELQRLDQARQHVDQVLLDEQLHVGPYVVSCSAFKALFFSKVEDLKSKVFSRVKKSMAQTCRDIDAEVERTIAVLDNRNTRDIEELTEVKEFVKNLPLQRQRIGSIIKEVLQQQALLEEYQVLRPEEELQRTYRSFAEPLRIGEHALDCRLHLEDMEKEFFLQLRTMNENLARDIEEAQRELEILQAHERLAEQREAEERCASLAETLEGCRHDALVSKRRERLFEVRESNFEELVSKLEESFAPYGRVWGLARAFSSNQERWMRGPLADIDRDQLTRDIVEASSALHQLARVDFKERRAMAQVALELKQLYDSFRPYLPLVCALRNPHLKTRHWNSIADLKTPPLEVESDLHQSLEALIEMGAMELVEDINEISHFATRERKLEE